MKKDLELKLLKEKDKRLRILPDFIADFIYMIETKKTLRTQIAYLKDYTIFLEFLKTLPEFESKDIKDFTPSDLDKLTERDIRDFLTYLSYYTKTYKKKNGKVVTQVFTNGEVGKARKLASLHVLYDWMFKNNMVSRDITKYIEIKIYSKKLIKDRLEEEDIINFLETIEKDKNIDINSKEKKFHEKVKLRDYNIVLILGFTGIRISELVQLDLDDINLDKQIMIVTRKGGNQEKIYLPKVILEPLAYYINERKKIKDIEDNSKNALFLSLQKKRISPKAVRYMLNKYKKRSNIDISKITPHTFRRSFAMKLYNDTGDIQLVADILGHATTETTRKHYAEPKEERKKRVMDTFTYKINQNE